MAAWIFASSAPKSGSAVGTPATAALAGVQRAGATDAVRTPATVAWSNRRRETRPRALVGGVMGTSSSLVGFHWSHFALESVPTAARLWPQRASLVSLLCTSQQQRRPSGLAYPAEHEE